MAKILLVEDDDAVRGVVERALQMDGHRITAAIDGGFGLEVLQDALDTGDHFDLMLSDIQMPVMDGIALALKAHEMAAQMPILLMTGYAEQRERAGNLQHVVRDVVAKPFTLKIIREAVVSALR